MEKKKAILHVDSFQNGLVTFSVSDFGVRAMLSNLFELCWGKYGGYVKLELSPPYKPRTTTVGGQNRHIWGHIQQIAQETGNELADVEEAIKERALKRGYPRKINQLTGRIKPASMTTINTVEAGYLIDELHQLAAELEITLDEGYD